MTAVDIIRLLLVISVMLLVLAVGLQGRWRDVTYARRHPDLLWRGFAAVNLFVPAAAVILCLLVPIPFPVKIGIVLMAVSPPAPFAPSKMLKAGADNAFVSGLFIVLILWAIILVPLTVALLNNLSPNQVQVPIIKVAAFILITMFLPLVIGIEIASKWPKFADKAAPITRTAAFAILIPVSLLIVFQKFDAVIALVGNGSVLTMTAVILIALAAGHALGGSSIEHRAAMAQVAATRHPGIAVMIAQNNFNDPEIIMAIALFLLLSFLLTAVYALWERKAYAAGTTARAH